MTLDGLDIPALSDGSHFYVTRERVVIVNINPLEPYHSVSGYDYKRPTGYNPELFTVETEEEQNGFWERVYYAVFQWSLIGPTVTKYRLCEYKRYSIAAAEIMGRGIIDSGNIQAALTQAAIAYEKHLKDEAVYGVYASDK
jgi:hypothetical protein